MRNNFMLEGNFLLKGLPLHIVDFSALNLAPSPVSTNEATITKSSTSMDRQFLRTRMRRTVGVALRILACSRHS